MHTPGWGTSFHFAHRLKHESHVESIRRHEHYLALRLGLAPGDKVGPMLLLVALLLPLLRAASQQ